MARTSLMTSIFLSPTAARMTRELGLLLDRSGGGGARSGGDRDGGGGGDAPLLFEQLGELGGLENGQARQVVDDLFQISHVVFSPLNLVRIDFASRLIRPRLLLA